jgi:tripartite-type tricarboxylate transporter receptor subunit TctC
VPSLREVGVADYELTTWMGLATPGHMPALVVARLAAETARALDAAATWAKLRQQGLEAVPRLDPVAFAVFVGSDFEKWGPVIRAPGATID